MKNNFVAILMILISLPVFSQENMVSLSGGYAFANIEDADQQGTGWRINGLYEFNPAGGPFAHGIAFGYIGLSAESTLPNETVTYKINSYPLYYSPKFMFGNEKFKGFVKGALGMQFAGLKREGPITSLSDNDFGFYGGGGAGFKLFLGEKLFLSAEYEIAWASNSWYSDGWMNSALGGIGIRF
ncbi:MAG: outer membrane beta-barrel protein [Bacteroidales bacterium]